MPTSQRYFFKKEDKLKSSKVIDKLFHSGNSFSNFPFKVMWMPGVKDGVLQAAFGVSSKNFKKATDRNRVKRLMRESYRLQKNVLEQHLLQHNRQLSLFIIYVGRELPNYEHVFEKIGVVLSRLIKFTNANPEANT